MDNSVLSELEKHLAEHPPRSIPANLAKRAGVEIGGLFSRRTAIFWLFLLAIFWTAAIIVIPWRYPAEVLIRLGWNESINARVTRLEKTSASIGGSSGGSGGGSGGQKSPGVPVYEVWFNIETPDGRRTETVNYFTGPDSIPGHAEGAFDEDGTVTKAYTAEVRYLPFSPACALLPGGRLSAFPPYAALIAIFPIGITVVCVVFLRKRRRFFVLLRDGELAEAEVADCRKTQVTVNGRPRYRATLKLSGRSGNGEAVVSAYGRRAELYQRLATEGGTIRVLWLSHIPDAVMPLVADSVE